MLLKILSIVLLLSLPIIRFCYSSHCLISSAPLCRENMEVFSIFSSGLLKPASETLIFLQLQKEKITAIKNTETKERKLKNRVCVCVCVRERECVIE